MMSYPKQAFPNELVSVLFRYLAVAARNQIPFTQVFHLLGNDKPIFGKYTKRLKQLGNHPNPSISLADLLATQDRMFAPATLALLAQAEASQQLAPVLDALVDDYAYQRRQSIPKSPLTQPFILFAVLATVIWIEFVFVIPSFQKVFHSFGGELPLPTEILFTIVTFIAHIGWGIVLLAVVGIIMVQYQLFPSIVVTTFWQGYYHIPGIGSYFARQWDARLTLWVARLGDNKTLLIAALQHLEHTTVVPSLRAKITRLVTALQAGETLTKALAQPLELPPSLLYAMRVTDAGKDANDAMALCQKLTQEQLTKSNDTLQNGIFFISYFAIGGLVAFFVIAMYLPIFTIGSVV